MSPLHESAYRGFLGLVKLLIEKGAAIDATDKDGWTPLHAACRQGNTEVVMHLVKAKANIDCRSRAGKLPREYAVDQGCELIVQLLDAASAGADLSKFTEGTTPVKANESPAAVQNTSPGSVRQTSVSEHRASQQKIATDVQRIVQNDPTLTQVIWSSLDGVDATALCSLADALPANSYVRSLNFSGVKALNDVIATRVSASGPYCTVKTIIMESTSVSVTKRLEIARLCLMDEVRQVAAGLPQLTDVDWKHRNADDHTVNALANALQGNRRVLMVDLSYNPAVQDASARRIAEVITQSAVQQFRLIDTGVSKDGLAAIQHLCALSNIAVTTAEATETLPDMQSLSLGLNLVSSSQSTFRSFVPAAITSPSPAQPSKLVKPIGQQQNAAPGKSNSRLFGWVAGGENDNAPAANANVWMPHLQQSLTSSTEPAPEAAWVGTTPADIAGGGGNAFGALALGPGDSGVGFNQQRMPSSLESKMDADWPIGHSPQPSQV